MKGFRLSIALSFLHSSYDWKPRAGSLLSSSPILFLLLHLFSCNNRSSIKRNRTRTRRRETVNQEVSQDLFHFHLLVGLLLCCLLFWSCSFSFEELHEESKPMVRWKEERILKVTKKSYSQTLPLLSLDVFILVKVSVCLDSPSISPQFLANGPIS